MRKEIENLIRKAVKKSFNVELEKIGIEKPVQESFGEHSTSIALVLAKKLNKDPKEIAGVIVSEVEPQKIFQKVEVAGQGFINFFVSKEYLQEQVNEILKKKKKYADLKIGKGKKINVEFISANPTGPLTLGNGRGGFCGDVLANVLEKAGYKTTREYYINDIGEQIRKLGHSVLGDAEAVYKGKYVDDLRERIGLKDIEKAGEEAAEIIFEKMIKPSVEKMKIKFDVWFSEKNLVQKKEIEKTLKELEKKKLIYQKDGAVWFKSIQFGDDKDRVLIKADGEKTYFLSDIAYLKNKFKRGFDKLIFFWGADHYGYVNRMKGAVEALGYKKEQTDFLIMQLVRLFENGQEKRMSKRTGIYVAIDELIDEVGLDVARFFFLSKSSDSHLNFDMELAKERSEKNPVFYIQYAHARICSILRKAQNNFQLLSIQDISCGKTISNFQLLNQSSEIKLMKKLIQLPEVMEDTAKDYQVQRLPQYAMELASAFHYFYTECRVIDENDKDLTQARLGLVLATKIVFKNVLDLMGISAPEKM